jgi:NAD(P)-dependent dehydrogenase (short-subunit alcohol dehydrogenase family)
MTRGILIAGDVSSLFDAIAAEAVKRVECFAAAPIPSRSAGGTREISAPALDLGGNLPAKSRLLLSWNPGSPISARSLVLAAENRLERIDEAVLVCVPPAINGAAAILDPVDIERMVNDHLKGWFFLVKELSSLFRTRKAGTLALVVPETAKGSRDALPELLGSAAAAAFRSFTQGLLAASFDEPYQTLGFNGADPGEEAPFAAFIFKTMEEPGRRNSGKWHKFGRLGLFNR